MLKSNGFMKDYYLEAGDILFKYYEGIENVETTRTDASPTDGGILSYLGIMATDEETTGDEVSDTSDTFDFFDIPASREDLRHMYLKKLMSLMKQILKNPLLNSNQNQMYVLIVKQNYRIFMPKAL